MSTGFKKEKILLITGAIASGKLTNAINIAIDKLDKKHDEIYIYQTTTDSGNYIGEGLGYILHNQNTKDFALLSSVHSAINYISIERDIECSADSKSIIEHFNITNISQTPENVCFNQEVSFNNKIVIIDQAQLLDKKYIRFLSKLEDSNAQIIFVGDMQQMGIHESVFDNLLSNMKENVIEVKGTLRTLRAELSGFAEELVR